MYTPPPDTSGWVPSAPNWYEMPRKCFACRGDDRNWKDEPEDPDGMLKCAGCKCHFHPSCSRLGRIASVIRRYRWRCDRCSKCEICEGDGDEEHYFYCAHCNRAYHTKCLNPKLPEVPGSEWKCPTCKPPRHATVSPTVRTSGSVRAPTLLNATNPASPKKPQSAVAGFSQPRRTSPAKSISASATAPGAGPSQTRRSSPTKPGPAPNPAASPTVGPSRPRAGAQTSASAPATARASQPPKRPPAPAPSSSLAAPQAIGPRQPLTSSSASEHSTHPLTSGSPFAPPPTQIRRTKETLRVSHPSALYKRTGSASSSNSASPAPAAGSSKPRTSTGTSASLSASTSAPASNARFSHARPGVSNAKETSNRVAEDENPHAKGHRSEKDEVAFNKFRIQNIVYETMRVEAAWVAAAGDTTRAAQLLADPMFRWREHPSKDKPDLSPRRKRLREEIDPPESTSVASPSRQHASTPASAQSPTSSSGRTRIRSSMSASPSKRKPGPGRNANGMVVSDNEVEPQRTDAGKAKPGQHAAGLNIAVDEHQSGSGIPGSPERPAKRPKISHNATPTAGHPEPRTVQFASPALPASSNAPPRRTSPPAQLPSALRKSISHEEEEEVEDTLATSPSHPAPAPAPASAPAPAATFASTQAPISGPSLAPESTPTPAPAKLSVDWSAELSRICNPPHNATSIAREHSRNGIDGRGLALGAKLALQNEMSRVQAEMDRLQAERNRMQREVDRLEEYGEVRGALEEEKKKEQQQRRARLELGRRARDGETETRQPSAKALGKRPAQPSSSTQSQVSRSQPAAQTPHPTARTSQLPTRSPPSLPPIRQPSAARPSLSPGRIQTAHSSTRPQPPFARSSPELSAQRPRSSSPPEVPQSAGSSSHDQEWEREPFAKFNSGWMLPEGQRRWPRPSD